MSICLCHVRSPDWCPNGAFAGFEKAQIGRGGGKALSDTDWHWLGTPAPVLVLLGFCDFGQSHAAVQRAPLDVLFSQEQVLRSMVHAAFPVKQGVLVTGGDPPVSGKLSAALLLLYFSGGRDRMMTWDIHRNVRLRC